MHHNVELTEQQINLIGKYVVDVTSNYQGYCTGLVFRFGGSVMVTVQPLSADGKTMPDSYSVDEHNIKITENAEYPHRENVFIIPDPEALKVGLGTKVRDNFSGAEGYTSSASIFQNGCVYYDVVLPMVENKPQPTLTYNWQRLSIVGEDPIKPASSAQDNVDPGKKSPGGPSMKMSRPT